MLKSKILIISTMILFILSISAVNAENVTSSMVNDTVNNEFHVIDGKYLEYNNSENGKNLNDTSNVLYDGKDGSVLENKTVMMLFLSMVGIILLYLKKNLK